jgi:tetratricopeptide (TPR) repeat protein
VRNFDQQRPPLPARLNAAEQDFYRELRRLVDAGGLSCRVLQDVTSARKSDSAESVFYSKSQWARWRNGDAQPPRKAVRRLAEHLEKEGLAADSLVQLWDQAFAPRQGAIRPRQIPASAQQFVGRTRELEALAALAEPAISGRGPAVIAIEGTGGVGKTTLATNFAWRVSDQFPDGQLYVNMHGFDPGGQLMHANDALRFFLDSLGVTPRGAAPGSSELAAEYRTVLAGKRVIVVVDNAYEAEQVRDLLPGGPGTLVLITSRNQLCALAPDGARLVRVEPFSHEEARELLADRLGGTRVSREPQAVAELIELCAHLPLALVVAAAHMETHPDFPLSALIKEFHDRGLDLLGTSARTVFATSYQHLSGTVARVFRLLGLHPGPDISLAAAVSLTAMPIDQVHRALSDLTSAHLVEMHKPARYSCHDLLRAFAGELTRAHDPEDARQLAIRRVLDHYLHSALTAGERLQPHRWGVRPPTALPGVVPVEVTDREQAMAWFEAECPVLLALIGFAEAQGFDEHAWLIPWATTVFLNRSGRHQDWVQTQRIAAAAAQRVGDRNAQAHSHYLLGYALSVTGDNAAAEPVVRRSLELFRELGDRGHEAMVLNGLAIMMSHEGRLQEALDMALDGLRTVKAAGFWWVEGTLDNTVGGLHGALGLYEQGLAHCQRAIGLHQEAGNFAAAGSDIETMGDIYRWRGDLGQACTAYRQAIEMHRDAGARFEEAKALAVLGDTLADIGDQPAAVRAWQAAQLILDRLAHPLADEVRAKLTARAGGEDTRPAS